MADRPWTSPLEDELRALGRSVAVGPTPDVRAAVRSTLAGPEHATPGRAAGRRGRVPFRRALPRRRLLAGAVAALIAVGGTLAVSPAARAAAVRLLSFAGIELRGEPPPGPRGAGTLPSQDATTVEQARRRVSFPLSVPEALGAPARVTVTGDARVVTLFYPATADRPAIRVDESGDGLEPFFQKSVDPRLAQAVQVGADPGLWVRTAHDVTFVDATGRARPETVRLAAATLIWRHGTVTVRLEGARSLPEALDLASTFR